MGKHFVLVHGAWHGGWVWDGVIEALKEAGHTVEAPTMPGHNPGDDRSGVTFDGYVDHLVDVLKKQSQPVVVVGHSSAGFLMQAAIPQAADKVERCVFHNAFILPDGHAQFDIVPPEVAQGMTAAAGASPDNCVPVDEGLIRGALMAGDPPEKVDSLIAKLVPQPLSLFTTKVPTAAFANLAVPKSYLFCKDDASLPPGAYLGMAQALGKFELTEIPGGHETIWVDPKAFTQALAKDDLALRGQVLFLAFLSKAFSLTASHPAPTEADAQPEKTVKETGGRVGLMEYQKIHSSSHAEYIDRWGSFHSPHPTFHSAIDLMLQIQSGGL